MHKTRALIPVAVGAISLLPAAASARAPVAHSASVGSKIVLFKSIGRIKVGMTPQTVKRKLGNPSHTIRVSGKIAEVDYDKSFQSVIHVSFDTLHKGDPANAIFGYLPSMHTSKGIHPGSSFKELKRAYGRAGLRRTGSGQYALDQGHPGAIGERETDFGGFHGKLVDIGIQAVLNDG
jgi:hypothetical protein